MPMRGSEARPIGPQAASLIGTCRQPATRTSSRSSSSARVARARSAAPASRGRNTLPAEKPWPRRMPASSATARRKASGRCNSTPQPSPVLPSARIAPRWDMRASDESAVSTSQRLGLLSRWAISPKPQLSCSKRGSNNALDVPLVFGDCMKTPVAASGFPCAGIASQTGFRAAPD